MEKIMIENSKYISRGSTSYPNGIEELHYNLVKENEDIKLGRWIYCKYCYKNVKPILVSSYQICCSECGYGLTPDFILKEELEYYIKTGEELNIKIDNKLKIKHDILMKKFGENCEKKRSISIGKDVGYIDGNNNITIVRKRG